MDDVVRLRRLKKTRSSLRLLEARLAEDDPKPLVPVFDSQLVKMLSGPSAFTGERGSVNRSSRLDNVSDVNKKAETPIDQVASDAAQKCAPSVFEPQRAPPRGSAGSEPSSSLFVGLCVWLCPCKVGTWTYQGVDKAAEGLIQCYLVIHFLAAGQLLGQKLAARGARISVDLDEEVTHVLAPADVPWDELDLPLILVKAALQVGIAPASPFILRADWVSNCIRAKCLLPVNNFLVLPPPSPRGTIGTPSVSPSRTLSSTCHLAPPVKSPSRFKPGAPPAFEEDGPTETFPKIPITEVDDRFACQRATTRHQAGEALVIDQGFQEGNRLLAEKLVDMAEVYKRAYGDEWRTRAYRQAANAIRGLSFRLALDNIDNLKDIKQLGRKGGTIWEHIREVLTTGRLRKLEEMLADPRIVALQTLTSVWGLGPSTAQQLYDRGFRTVEDLSRDPEQLTAQQRVGLAHHADLQERIPRAEVAQAAALVCTVLKRVSPRAMLRTVGSFRRGAVDCGDIDLLVVPPTEAGVADANSQESDAAENLLKELVRELTALGFITDHLSGSQSKASFMGICKLPCVGSRHRHIDIKVYSQEALAFGLLHFTGNDYFNRSMRRLAASKGFSLSEHGLVPVNRGPKRQKVRLGASVKCASEEDIFKALGMEFVDPAQRGIQ
ncbi:hypothetical protein CYMTET_7321 [Cymbomonas tetramitiformis]|uniref:DNA polymerase n=1 Tax=Cymbomonas tetramitiformis TaxID=36881 RepID=A0AAE0GVY1_9CHLO|nr:hypothetical protein CYMTET_7321 [Cymbomonas tetramitiformis]